MSHIDPDYPRFWIVVIDQEKIGPFYGEQVAKVWARERGLETAKVETVTYTSKWDEDHGNQ